MKQFAFTILSITLLLGCSSPEEVDDESQTNDSSESISPAPEDTIKEIIDTNDFTPVMETVIPQQDVTSEVFENEDGSWGYKIFLDGSLYVTQPHIPAVQGKNGFKSASDAQKTADLVANKVKQGVSPPTVSTEELLELGVVDN